LIALQSQKIERDNVEQNSVVGRVLGVWHAFKKTNDAMPCQGGVMRQLNKINGVHRSLFTSVFLGFDKRTYIFLLLCVVLVGCAPLAKFDAAVQPEWVSGISQKYPKSVFFVAKSRASALDVAAKNARNALADSLPEASARSASGALPSALAALTQNAEVVDAWFDKDSQLHYALVAVERAAAKQVLQQQLAELNTRTARFVRTATQEADPLLQISAIREALGTQPQRADLLLALQTLGGNAAADVSVWSIIEMQVHLKSLLSSIDVRPRTGADRQLNSAVVRGLDAAGYLSTRMTPSFELKTTLQRSGMKWEQGWFTEQGILFVELLDRNNQLRAKAQWPLRAKTQERAMLEKELMGEVTNVLSEQLAETVLGLIQAKE